MLIKMQDKLNIRNNNYKTNKNNLNVKSHN